MADAPSQDDLRLGLGAAIAQYLQEADLHLAVGESGVINVKLTLDLQKGFVNTARGAVWFERAIRFGGKS